MSMPIIGRLLLPLVVLLGLSAPAFAEPKQTASKPNPEARAARAEIERTFGFAPAFLAAMPDVAIAGAWQELRDLGISDKTALPSKTKELIGLAVASQIPCKYCTYTHAEFAKAFGASKDQLGEAVVQSAMTRHWSTFMKGLRLAEAKFERDIDQLVARMKTMAQSKQPEHVPVNVVLRMLAEKPDIAGITLPGMPTGSPGMGGSKNASFVIYSFGKDGGVPQIYAVE